MKSFSDCCRLGLSLLTVVIFWLAAPASADEITGSIEEALKAYKKGRYTIAVEGLNYAAQLIQQKKGKVLAVLLPEPLEGWTAEKAISTSSSPLMFGGGITAERTYMKDSSGTVTVEIVTDSPLMQSVMMMLANPMFAKAGGGMLERIAGQKAIVKYKPDTRSGDIKIVVADRYYISIEGSGITFEELKGFAGAIDYKMLETML